MVMRSYPENHKQPKVGDILEYRMRIEDNPQDPTRVWHGTILRVLLEQNRAQARYYEVQSIEYDDCTELVYQSQIVRFYTP